MPKWQQIWQELVIAATAVLLEVVDGDYPC